MKHKKLIAGVLTVILLLTITACKSKDAEQKTDIMEDSSVTEEVEAETADTSADTSTSVEEDAAVNGEMGNEADAASTGEAEENEVQGLIENGSPDEEPGEDFAVLTKSNSDSSKDDSSSSKSNSSNSSNNSKNNSSNSSNSSQDNGSNNSSNSQDNGGNSSSSKDDSGDRSNTATEEIWGALND